MSAFIVASICALNIVNGVKVSPLNPDPSGDVTVELTPDPRGINQVVNGEWKLNQKNGDAIYNWYVTP